MLIVPIEMEMENPYVQQLTSAGAHKPLLGIHIAEVSHGSKEKLACLAANEKY